MIILSTADVICSPCGGKSPAGLLEIRDRKPFICPHCTSESIIDPAKHSHDIAMYEWAQRQFGGKQDGDR